MYVSRLTARRVMYRNIHGNDAIILSSSSELSLLVSRIRNYNSVQTVDVNWLIQIAKTGTIVPFLFSSNTVCIHLSAQLAIQACIEFENKISIVEFQQVFQRSQGKVHHIVEKRI
jgi:hypothetical protein